MGGFYGWITVASCVADPLLDDGVVVSVLFSDMLCYDFGD